MEKNLAHNVFRKLKHYIKAKCGLCDKPLYIQKPGHNFYICNACMKRVNNVD